jgi:dephospho-CoA kinase
MGGNALIIIGVTGKYCAGKSSISKMIGQRGCREIDVDKLGHQALELCKQQLVDKFSDKILNDDNSINRLALKEIVFSKGSELKKLESIVHPKMVEMTLDIIKQEKDREAKAVIINAALLHRMHLDLHCDILCYVKSPLLIRYSRAKVRDNVTCKSFIRMQQAQKDIRMTNFDGNFDMYVVHNGTKNELIHRQVDEFCITIGI